VEGGAKRRRIDDLAGVWQTWQADVPAGHTLGKRLRSGGKRSAARGNERKKKGRRTTYSDTELVLLLEEEGEDSEDQEDVAVTDAEFEQDDEVDSRHVRLVAMASAKN
jgi:hypothetical protein